MVNRAVSDSIVHYFVNTKLSECLSDSCDNSLDGAENKLEINLNSHTLFKGPILVNH